MKTHTIKITWLILAVCFLCLTSILSCQSPHYQKSELNVRFISNINHEPLFSWKISGNSSEFRQSAYRILIADNMDDLKNDVGNIRDTEIQKGYLQRHSEYKIQAGNGETHQLFT